MGFVDKFCEAMRLRKKVSQISAEMKAHKWSYSWSFIWENELYNRSVIYSNPIFEKLFKPIMDAKTKKDRVEGSNMVLSSMRAQIGALLISMNQEYLTLMNITLFDEVIYKFMDPTSSQFVVVALARAGMV